MTLQEEARRYARELYSRAWPDKPETEKCLNACADKIDDLERQKHNHNHTVEKLRDEIRSLKEKTHE